QLFCQNRQTRRYYRDSKLCASAFVEEVDQSRFRRRKKYSVWFIRHIFNRAEHANEAIDLVVVRFHIGVVNRPVFAESVDAFMFEVLLTEAQRDPAPVIRASPKHA